MSCIKLKKLLAHICLFTLLIASLQAMELHNHQKSHISEPEHEMLSLNKSYQTESSHTEHKHSELHHAKTADEVLSDFNQHSMHSTESADTDCCKTTCDCEECFSGFIALIQDHHHSGIKTDKNPSDSQTTPASGFQEIFIPPIIS